MSDEQGYASAAPLYWSAGWKGILPLPSGAKYPPPKDTTGYKGYYPSWPDIMAWSDEQPSGNIGLRLPNSVVGIDVDHYSDKRGGDTLARAESLWGTLPPTVRSTSRIDGKSGIRLYHVEPGTQLETLIQFPELGLGGIEVVQFFHRYCVVWPSLHPGTDRRYRWLDADGNITGDIPRPASLPLLPQGWVDGLKRQESAAITTTADVNKALQSLPSGRLSQRVKDAVTAAKTDLLANPGTRHDTTLKHVLRLLRLAEQGEPGIQDALHQLEDEFVKVITKDGSRDVESARSEYRRMVAGQRGHNLIASTPTVDEYELVGIPKPGGGFGQSVTYAGSEPSREIPERAVVNACSDVEAAWIEHLSTEDGNEFDRLLFADDDEPAAPGPADDWAQDDFDFLLFADDEPEEVGRTGFRTSWGPVDMEAVLSGDLSPEDPAYLYRADGKPLFYKGRVNSLVGPPESAKSWVALIACVQAILAGENVLILDFEDTAKSIAARFLAMQLQPSQLVRHLAYAEPDAALDSDAQEDIAEVLDTLKPGIVVVDGVNAAMTTMGMDLGNNVDATKFHQLVLKPLTRANSAVITIDHVTKDSEGRGSYAIGAQAKKAMTDGAMIGVRPIHQFGRGRLGESELIVLKDKPGGVRAIAERRGKAGLDYLASVILDARIEGRMDTQVIFREAEENDATSSPERALIVKMIEVSKFMETEDPEKKGLTLRAITNGVPGRRIDVEGALHQLVQIHHVGVETGPRSAKIHTLRSAYNGPDADQILGLGGD
ncbi:bifunctional DNA primase/polymerase [Nocardia sp. NPDC057440]|uniref:bifunctional DNA primase/polymerase n=1 Tax=Nocardia sp. NPDC057440 TaxID=3346134 RepID=UPI00366EFAF3